MISIIIPIYNLSEYLKSSIVSLLHQTSSNFEAIVIDDGSDDNSLEIINALVGKNENFRVYSKVNKGLAHTRNFGVEFSQGEYIYFLDGDDAIHPKFVETIENLIDVYKADVISFKSKNVMSVNDMLGFSDLDSNVLVKRENFMSFSEKLIFQDEIRYEVWSKVFKKTLIEDIRFIEGQIFEDVYFNKAVLLKEPNFISTNLLLHNYLSDRNGNTNSTKFSENKISVYKEYAEWISLIDDPSVKNSYCVSVLIFTFGQYFIHDEKLAEKMFFQEYKKLFSIKSVIFSRYTVSKKIFLIIFRISPKLMKGFMYVLKRNNKK